MINDSKTNLADNGLHSLNMGEVRHVCRLKTEENKKQIKENIMCRLKMNMPSPCGFNESYMGLNISCIKSLRRLLLKNYCCKSFKYHHRFNAINMPAVIYINKVIESAKTISRYPERCIGRGGRYLRSASIHSYLRPRNNAWSALPNKARMQSLPGLPLVPLPWVNFPTECQEGAPSVTDNYPNGQSCYQYTHS